MKRIASFLFVILFLNIPRISAGSQPVEVLHQAVGKAIQIMEGANLSSDLERNSRLEELWDLAREVFDFQEFARRSLASNWKRFTAEERKEFTAAFTDFLKRIYLPRAAGGYDGQEVRFMGEEILDETNALVKVQILWKNITLPIEVRMLKRNSRWRVYDVLFQGISALKNYRAQFQSLLRRETPADVIERLKQK
jgi:phospholipid transport system substrate-binding protein